MAVRRKAKLVRRIMMKCRLIVIQFSIPAQEPGAVTGYNSSMDRRKFIAMCTSSIPTAWVVMNSGLLLSCTKKNEKESILSPELPKGAQLIREDATEAQQLHFTYNHVSVDESVQMGKGSSDMCATCAYYEPYKDGEYGKCARLNGYVPHEGWCKGYRRKGGDEL